MLSDSDGRTAAWIIFGGIVLGLGVIIGIVFAAFGPGSSDDISKDVPSDNITETQVSTGNGFDPRADPDDLGETVARGAFTIDTTKDDTQNSAVLRNALPYLSSTLVGDLREQSRRESAAGLNDKWQRWREQGVVFEVTPGGVLPTDQNQMRDSDRIKYRAYSVEVRSHDRSGRDLGTLYNEIHLVIIRDGNGWIVDRITD